MSELHPKDYEQLITPEQDAERQAELLAQHEKQKDTKNTHAENIESIRSTIDQQALSQETQPASSLHEHHNDHRPHHYLTKSIKTQQYKKTIAEVQKNLTPSERRLSKVVHQPVIEKVSEVAGKTITRPSGIIGGALFALIGSSIIMYTARHIGFELPSTIFAILFIIGFFIGLCVELLIFSLTHTKRKRNAPKHY